MSASNVMQYQLRVTSVGARGTKSRLKTFWASKKKTHHRYFRASPIAASGALYEVAAAGDILDVLFISGISLSIAVNIGVSALPLLVGPRDAMKLKQIREDDSQDIKWGVMSILSFFPLLNWLAWVFGALDDEERAPIYYTNALVYLLPWLSRGFELDRFAIACLLAGILNVQLERVAQTEPENFQLPSPDIVKVPLQQVAKALTATARSYEETLVEAVEVAEERLLSDRQPSSQEKDDRDSEELRRRELQAWDEKLDLSSKKERDNG